MGQGQGGLVYWFISIQLFINGSNRSYATEPTTERPSQSRKHLEDNEQERVRRTLEQKLQGLNEEIKRKGEKTNKLQSSLIANEEYDELRTGRGKYDELKSVR